jgi:alkyl hydroperoxide reductase subunit AhpC
LSAVADKAQEFRKLDVQVLSCSTDSRFIHKMWQEHELSKMVKGGFPFPMLSDAGGKIGSVDVRGRFIIDPDGVIQAIEILTPPVGRKVAESLRQVQAFQHVRKTKGAEATPAGWEPGKPTLKVGPALVGKVWEVWKPNA